MREPARPGQATPAPATGPEPGPPADRSQAVKLAVIFGCLAASTLLLFRDRILPAAAVAASDPEGVTALIMEGFAAQAAERNRRLAQRLQWAETAWLQEDYPLAVERYTALKRYLDGSRLDAVAGAGSAADDWQTRLAGHVDARLADLARR